MDNHSFERLMLDRDSVFTIFNFLDQKCIIQLSRISKSMRKNVLKYPFDFYYVSKSTRHKMKEWNQVIGILKINFYLIFF